MATIPDEKIGVAVLTNQEWAQVPGMLMCDVFDAYWLGPESAFDKKKWSFWKKAEPHPDEGRKRDLATARAKRKPGTLPTVELSGFAGSYKCGLYGDIAVSYMDDKLAFTYAATSRRSPITGNPTRSIFVDLSTKTPVSIGSSRSMSKMEQRHLSQLNDSVGMKLCLESFAVRTKCINGMNLAAPSVSTERQRTESRAMTFVAASETVNEQSSRTD